MLPAARNENTQFPAAKPPRLFFTAELQNSFLHCPLQDLLCYLARLARHSHSCSAEGLAGVLGPVLLDPESASLPVDADSLTLAAIWVVQTLIR